MNKLKQSKLLSVFSNAFTVGVLAWLVVKWFRGDGIKTAFNNAQPYWFAGAVLCLLVFLLCDALVFHVLILKINDKARFKKSVYTTLIGRFYFNTTPLGVPIQIKLVSGNGVNGAEAASIYIQKSKLFQIIMLAYASAGFIYQYISLKNKEFIWIAAIVIGFNSFIFILYSLFSIMPERFIAIGKTLLNLILKIKFIKNPKELAETLENSMTVFLTRLKLFRAQWRVNVTACVFLAVELFSLFSITYFIYRAFGNSGYNLFQVVLMQSVAYAFASLIFLPGNAGGSEGGFYLFCAPLFQKVQIVPAIILWRFVTYFLVIIFGTAAIIEKRIADTNSKLKMRKTSCAKIDK